MTSQVLAASLLEVAEQLMHARPRSSGFRRRAISTAYYAVFHQVAALCADTLISNIRRGEPNYERVYRSLDHGSLKRLLDQPDIRRNEQLRRIASFIIDLHSERHRADYLPLNPELFPVEEVAELVLQARQTVQSLSALGRDDRRLLATCLLFKPR